MDPVSKQDNRRRSLYTRHVCETDLVYRRSHRELSPTRKLLISHGKTLEMKWFSICFCRGCSARAGKNL